MIKLSALINPTIYLREDNSGYTDYQPHKEISEKIYGGWLFLLNNITEKNTPIFDLKNNDLVTAIETGIYIPINLHDESTSGEVTSKINVLLAVLGKHENIVIQGGATNIHSSPIEIYLKISGNFTINDVLKSTDYIKNIAHHEAVHVVKYYQKTFQFSSRRDDVTATDKNWIYKYYTHPSELHSYIAQLNNELKNIKQKHSGISFSEALKSSSIWCRYEKNIFWKNPKIKNKMLAKLANNWNKL